MRKIRYSMLLLVAFLMTSCTEKGKVEINYTIIYPDTTIITDTLVEYRYITEDRQSIWIKRQPTVTSSSGTNYINVGDKEIVSTTCPIRINWFKYIE